MGLFLTNKLILSVVLYGMKLLCLILKEKYRLRTFWTRMKRGEFEPWREDVTSVRSSRASLEVPGSHVALEMNYRDWRF